MMDMVEPLIYAHEMAMGGKGDIRRALEKLIEAYPQLSKQMQKNMERYGMPVVAGSFGARWPEDLPGDVHELLEQSGYRPMEIVLRPEDSEAQHWSVEWHLLKWDPKRGYVRIIDEGR